MDNALTLALGLCLGLVPVAGIFLIMAALKAGAALRRMINKPRRR